MASTERAEDAVRHRMERAGVFKRGPDGELWGTYQPADDDPVALAFAGMDIDQKSVREWLDGLTQGCCAMLVVLGEQHGGLTPQMISAAIGGAAYQASIFGWELAQEDPDAAA